MKIPKKVKVGGHWVYIDCSYMFQEVNDTWAQYNDPRKLIRVQIKDEGGNVVSESFVAGNIIHEIVHAMDIIAGQEFFGKDKEIREKRIEGLSQMILQVLVDNKWLEVE